jgi:hypothetical protein
MAITIPIISEFKPQGIDKAIAEFKKLEGAGAKAKFVLGKAAKASGAALVGLGAAAGVAVKAAMEDQQAQAVLANTLQKTTKATAEQVTGVEDYISQLTLASGIADDQLRPALANLARATGSVESAQEGLGIALDVSAATGQSVESVSKALAKAYAGNTGALKKLSPALANMVENGASMEEVNAALTKQFGGSQKKAAETAAGKMKIFGNAINEAKESIGAALLPIIDKLLPYLASFADWAGKNTDLLVILGAVVGGLAVSIIAVNTAIKIWTAVTKAFSAVQAVFNAIMAANPIVLVTLAILAVIGVLVLAYKKFEGFRNIVDTVFSAVKTGVTGVYDFFKKYVDLILGVWKGVFNTIADVWNNTLGKLSFKFPGWVPGLGGKGFDVPDIPKLANGGIVTAPTLALIGEAGPEAVVPLNRANGMGNNITIHVNGGDPNAVVDALRRYMKTNGSVPIRVSA